MTAVRCRVVRSGACIRVADVSLSPPTSPGGSTAGALDAALVLRTLIGDGEETWLRVGAGVTAQSSPDREIEETCEKLHSRPALRFSTD